MNNDWLNQYKPVEEQPKALTDQSWLEQYKPVEAAQPPSDDNIWMRGLKSGVAGAKSLGTAALFAAERNAETRLQELEQVLPERMQPQVQAAARARQERDREHQTELLKAYERYKQEAAAAGKDIPEFTDVLRSEEKAKDFYKWLSFNLPNAAVWLGPMMAIAATGGAGAAALAGGVIGKGDLVSDRIDKVMEPFKGVVDEKSVAAVSKEVDETQALTTALAVPYAAAEFLGPVGNILAGRYGKEAIAATAKEIAKNGYFINMIKEAGFNTIEEWLGEASQEMIIDVLKKLRDNTDLFTWKNVEGWINAGFAAAPGGTVAGAGGGAVRKYKADQEERKKLDPRKLILDKIEQAKQEQMGQQIYEDYKQEVETTQEQERNLGPNLWKDYLEEVGPQLDLNFTGKKRKYKPKYPRTQLEMDLTQEEETPPTEPPAPPAPPEGPQEPPTRSRSTEPKPSQEEVLRMIEELPDAGNAPVVPGPPAAPEAGPEAGPEGGRASRVIGGETMIFALPYQEPSSRGNNIVEGIETIPVNQLIVVRDHTGKPQIALVRDNKRQQEEDGKYYNQPVVELKDGRTLQVPSGDILETFITVHKRGNKGIYDLKGGSVAVRIRMIEAAVKKGWFPEEVGNQMTAGVVDAVARFGYDEGSPKIPTHLMNFANNFVRIKDLMQWFISSDDLAIQRPDLQELARRIAPFIDEHTRVFLYPNQTETDADNPAEYWRDRHKIILSGTGMESAMVLHEIVHALSVRILAKYFSWDTKGNTSPRIPLEQMPPHIQKLYNIWKQMASGAAKTTETRRSKKRGTYEITRLWLGSGYHYGLTNIAEMVSEGLTNRVFQREMLGRATGKTMKDSKPAWKKFIEYVGAMFGFYSLEEQNMFRQFIEAASDTFAQQKDSWDTLPKELGKIEGKEFKPFGQAIDVVLEGEVSAADGMADAASSIKDDEDIRAEQMPTVDWIPKDPTAEEIIDMAVEDTDGSDLQNFYAGALQAAEIRRSKLIKGIYRLMDNARKRAERWEREKIQPVEKLFARILRRKADTLLMLDIFKRELRNNQPFTEAEIMRVVKSPELWEAYVALRSTLKEAMLKQNDALLSMGFKPVTELDAYFAARWTGPWTSILRDKDGKIVWAVRETSKKKAQKAVDWILQRHPSLKAEEIHYSKSRMDQNQLVAGYEEMLKLLDPNNPYTEDIQKAWERAITGDTTNVLSQEKHFIKKTGVEGFRGDRPWADEFEDARDFFIEQFKYLKGANKWSEMQKPLQTAKKVLTDKDVLETNKNNVKYAREYLKINMGYGTNEGVDRIEKVIAEWLGKDVQGFEQIVAMTKALFYITKLGYNIGYTVYALLQPTLGAGRHARLTQAGYHHNPGVTVVKAIYDGMAFSIYHWLRNFIRWRNLPANHRAFKMLEQVRNSMTKEGQIAADYMEQNGIVDINPMTDIQDLKMPENIHLLRAIGGWTITGSEQISRSMAFFGFVHHLAQSGQMNLDDMFLMAEDGTKDTMVDYRPEERAMFFTKMGIAGKGLATLNTFKFNWMSQIWKYAKLGYIDGNWYPFAMQMGSYLLLSGMVGLVGVDDAEEIWEYILSMVDDKTFMKLKGKSLKRVMIENMPEWMAYGGVGYLTGTNIQTRGSLGDIVPFSPFDDTLDNLGRMFPFVGDTARTAMAGVGGLGLLTGTGDENVNRTRVYRGIPTFAKGPLEVATGWFGGDKGQVTTSTADPSLGVLQRDEKDKFARYFGLRTQKEAEAVEGRYRKDKMDRQTNQRRSAASKRFREAMIKGKSADALDQLNNYITLGGDPKYLVSSGRMTGAMIRRTLSYADQLRVKAKPGNRAAIMSLIDYLENYQPVTE